MQLFSSFGLNSQKVYAGTFPPMYRMQCFHRNFLSFLYHHIGWKWRCWHCKLNLYNSITNQQRCHPCTHRLFVTHGRILCKFNLGLCTTKKKRKEMRDIKIFLQLADNLHSWEESSYGCEIPEQLDVNVEHKRKFILKYSNTRCSVFALLSGLIWLAVGTYRKKQQETLSTVCPIVNKWMM